CARDPRYDGWAMDYW
nr:immunoglobulin heavy chain junction region [Mus musculus]MBK4184694.1 immunoglobulin heavy chain junction region [Mus musculus]